MGQMRVSKRATTTFHRLVEQLDSGQYLKATITPECTRCRHPQ